ncbi:MAG: ComEA family DNA-binding protein [Campylobacterales bacterium]
MKRFLVLMATLAVLLFAKVDINSASADQLSTLKGIGPAKAALIVDWREKNGKFKTVDELTQVKGIGSKTLENIRNEITVSK